MRRMHWQLLGSLLATGWLAAADAALAAGPAALAEFASREYLGLDWPRTLVTYQLLRTGLFPDSPLGGAEFPPTGPALVDLPPTGVQPGLLRLVDGAGNDVPCQLSRVRLAKNGALDMARLSFFAALPKNGEFHYQLVEGKPATAPAPAVKETPTGAFLELDNGVTAIRLPKAGVTVFDPPLCFGQDQKEMVGFYGKQVENGVAPGPIQGIRLADGRWVGGSFFWAADSAKAPRVIRCECRVTERGPLFAEAEIIYQFTDSSRYRMTVRMLANDPAVQIDEQYDFGGPGDMWSYRLMVSLGAGGQGGWKPDVAYFHGPRLQKKDPVFGERLKAGGIESKSAGAAAFGSVRLDYAQPATQVLDLAVRHPWALNAYFIGLVDSTQIGPSSLADTLVPFVGVVPVHTGNWRASATAKDAMLWSYGFGDVCLNWPLLAPPHPRTALQTGEYDPALPLTFGRRQWLLVGGSFQTPDELYGLRLSAGWVSLDDYKEWVLDWPQDPKVTYPRLLFSREQAQQLKAKLDRLPNAATLKTYLYFNESDARRTQLWNALANDSIWSGPYGMARGILTAGDPPDMPWATHYRLAQQAGWASDADELLSSEKLDPEQRRKFRIWLAAVCYTVTEPDVNPRGSMTHLGNPNMPINRFCALPFVAALIPDHPMAKQWLDISAEYVRYKLAMNTAPGGAWSELITYFAASAPHLMQSAGVLAQTGRLDDPTARLAVAPALFTAGLLTPRDPRFGARLVPGWGHEGTDNAFHFLVAANVVRKLDPPAAQALVWSWDQVGRIISGHHDAGFSPRAQVYADMLEGIPPGYVPPQLASQWYPGFGVTLRAHAGDANETYMSLRNGYNYSHSDANQGDFVLYARGAPLVSLALMGYPLHQHPPFQELDKTFGWHSRVRFGSPGNTGGWPGGGARGGVPAFGFSDSVDYARAVGDYGPQTWTRQVLFLKARKPGGPDCFVLRDSADALDGDPAKREPKWWVLRTVGRKEQVKATATEIQYTSAFGPHLTAHFLQPAKITAESREAERDSVLYMGVGDNWRKAGSPAKNASGNVEAEDWLTISSVGPVPPGEDVLVALVPTGKGEEGPTYTALANGAAKIATRDGTDYVFVDRKPMAYDADGVGFRGVAGAVRVFPDEVHLVISEGPGSVSWRGVTLTSQVPTVKIVSRAEVEKQPARAFMYEAPGVKWKLKDTPLPEGCRVAGLARCELRIENDRMSGRSEGLGGLLYAPMPPAMKVLPMLVIDGQTYAPGTSGGTLIIPLLPGEHKFEVLALKQPPIFRNWQAW